VTTFLVMARLVSTLRAVCPDVEASVGTFGDSASVRLDFAAATPAGQISAAQSALSAFDWSQAAQDAYDAQQAARVVGAVRAVRKTTDEAFSTTNFADVADLSILLAPNSHYEFEAYGGYTAALATTGAQVSVNGPASPNLVRFIGYVSESVTSDRKGAGANYDVAIAGTGSAGATALPWGLQGSISTGATGGLFTVRARSEVAGSAVTILRGSILKVSAVA
jgi:hypothetical protein